MESTVSEHSLHLRVLQAQINYLQGTHPIQATFNPGSDGYVPVMTPVGTFLVMLEKVTPYADGQRLTFKIGNIQAADYHDPELTISWSTRPPSVTDENYKEALPIWSESVRTKTEKPLTRLRAGHWNRINIVVSPATSAEVGFIELRMGVETVSMPTR